MKAFNPFGHNNKQNSQPDSEDVVLNSRSSSIVMTQEECKFNFSKNTSLFIEDMAKDSNPAVEQATLNLMGAYLKSGEFKVALNIFHSIKPEWRANLELDSLEPLLFTSIVKEVGTNAADIFSQYALFDIKFNSWPVLNKGMFEFAYNYNPEDRNKFTTAYKNCIVENRAELNNLLDFCLSSPDYKRNRVAVDLTLFLLEQGAKLSPEKLGIIFELKQEFSSNLLEKAKITITTLNKTLLEQYIKKYDTAFQWAQNQNYKFSKETLETKFIAYLSEHRFDDATKLLNLGVDIDKDKSALLIDFIKNSSYAHIKYFLKHTKKLELAQNILSLAPGFQSEENLLENKDYLEVLEIATSLREKELLSQTVRTIQNDNTPELNHNSLSLVRRLKI